MPAPHFFDSPEFKGGDGFPFQYRLASYLLGESVGDWIARERRPDEDLRRSWPKVARNLAEATDGTITVSGSTVRRWSEKHAYHLQGRL